ncbi:MAG: hypothetical protein IKU30_06055 [Clostridia bacterium]|nr:hypothetical protein [Clostridia bacterium]
MKKLVIKMLVLGISMEQIFEFIADFNERSEDEKREFVRAASMLLD